MLKSCIPGYTQWKLVQDHGPEYGAWRASRIVTDTGDVTDLLLKSETDLSVGPGNVAAPIFRANTDPNSTSGEFPMLTVTGHDDGMVGLKSHAPARKVAGRRLRLRRGITIDSGAANNVMPRRMVRNKTKIRPSPSSKRGVHYVAANNGRIPNEGEIDFSFTTSEGNEEEFVVQIAEVNKALGAVSYLVDRGYRVVFDKDTDSGKDISYMMKKETKVTSRFRRDRNIWTLDAYVDQANSDESFHRQA